LSFATSFSEPITVVSHRNKANPFRRPSILFRPHDPQMKDVGGDAGYRPRVRSAYYERVYVHSSRRSTLDIGASCRQVRYDSSGFSLFFSGLAEVFLNLKKTLIICIPWIVILGWLSWYVMENPGPIRIVAWIAGWLSVPGIAVPWHRYMLSENIDPSRVNAGGKSFLST